VIWVSFGGSLLVVSFEKRPKSCLKETQIMLKRDPNYVEEMGFFRWSSPKEMEWSLCIGSCEGID